MLGCEPYAGKKVKCGWADEVLPLELSDQDLDSLSDEGVDKVYDLEQTYHNVCVRKTEVELKAHQEISHP